MKTSPLAPTAFPALPAIAGVRLAVGETGIRYKNRPDLLVAELAAGTQSAGVFTKSLVTAAPVEWCKKALTRSEPRLLVVNAGNANACTGAGGMQSVERVVKSASGIFGCLEECVLMASTGVIGEPLADDKITHILPALKSSLREDGWHDAARAIMTTDTFMKVATASVKIGDTQVTINGIAKGSGMIAPNMATLLAFVFTDATIPSSLLRHLLAEANEDSFNSITVDGDASTNDTVMAFATCKKDHPYATTMDDFHLREFRRALSRVMSNLAQQVVKDGEGAEKFVSITVKGANSKNAAQKIGLTIANSPLVKTAIAGEDANWGRIFAAAGRAGEFIDPNALSLWIGGALVAEDGARAASYDEAAVTAHMKGQNLDIVLHVGVGNGTATVYTCDLTHGYIDINGSYRS